MGSSPSPLRPVLAAVLMNYPEAITAVIDGKRITRLEWNDPDIYGMLRDGMLMIRRSDTGWHTWIINDGDLLSDDWVVVSLSKRDQLAEKLFGDALQQYQSLKR